MASRSSWEQFVKNGYGKFVAQIGGSQTDVPQLGTMVSDPAAKAVIALIQSQGDIARLTAGPPDIPPDRLAALRDAYKKSMADPELQARAEKLERPVDPAFGEDVLKMVQAALNQTPETVALLKEALEAGDKAAPPCDKRFSRGMGWTGQNRAQVGRRQAVPGGGVRIAHRHHDRRAERRARSHQGRHDLHDRGTKRRGGKERQLQLTRAIKTPR